MCVCVCPSVGGVYVHMRLCVCHSVGGVYVHMRLCVYFCGWCVCTCEYICPQRSSLGIGVVFSLSRMYLLLVKKRVSAGHPHACVQGREQLSGADPVPRLELGSSGLPAGTYPNWVFPPCPLLLHPCPCMCAWVRVRVAKAHIRGQRTVWGVFLSLHYMGPRNGARVIRLGGQCLCDHQAVLICFWMQSQCVALSGPELTM